MDCRVCGNPLPTERAVFRCACEALTHAQCWGKHIIESHEPIYAVGTITMDLEFKPNESVEGDEGKGSI